MAPNREGRKAIAKETLEILNRGFITENGENHDIFDTMKNTREKSKCFDEEELNSLRAKPVPQTFLRPGEQTAISMSSKTSIGACIQLRNSIRQSLGAESRVDWSLNKIGCLNFASARNVCGGMLKGSLAQEESLGLSSTLFDSLSQFDDQYYSVNNRNPREGYYHDNLIYTPDVLVFRDDSSLQQLPFNETFPVHFISCPAVNKGRALKAKSDDLEPIDQVMRRRIHNVLQVAAVNGIQHLVLGAWGCGVFKNEPEDIARHFRHFLIGPGALFGDIFKTVIFAFAKDDNNSRVFSRVLLP